MVASQVFLHRNWHGASKNSRYAIAAAMGAKQIAAIYSSPLERTKEQQELSRKVGIKVKQERGLLELDVGDWTGRKLSHLRKLNAWSAVQVSFRIQVS